MPIVSYCKKCKKEVPVSDICTNCGKKLPKNSERMSWYYVNIPAKDWVSWNHIMRFFLPVLFFILLLVTVIEGLTRGVEGVKNLLAQGLFQTFLAIGLVMTFLVFILLLFQGKETIHLVIDHLGVHSYTYLVKPSKMKWMLRFQPIKKKDGQADLTGFVAEKHLPWANLRGIALWPDQWKILMYYPKFWVAVPLYCTPMNYEEVLGYLSEKLQKKSGIKIKPPIERVIS